MPCFSDESFPVHVSSDAAKYRLGELASGIKVVNVCRRAYACVPPHSAAVWKPSSRGQAAAVLPGRPAAGGRSGGPLAQTGGLFMPPSFFAASVSFGLVGERRRTSHKASSCYRYGTIDWVLLVIWQVHQGVEIWQPPHAACLQAYLASWQDSV